MNENGDVMTSSPALTPEARSARCSPAVPLDTAIACCAPSRRAKAVSNAGSIGPSESWPDIKAFITSSCSRSPISGRASGIGVALRPATPRR